MPDLSDQALIKNALSGDQTAFRQLVERHQAFVYRVSYRMVANVGDAEDITQDTFIRLWKNLGQYRENIKLTTWLYKIATNRCLDCLRSRHNRATKRTSGLDGSEGVSGGWSADQDVLHDDLRKALERFTDQLSPKQKAVFVLRDVEDLDMAAIGDILSMDAGQVKSNLYYARKKIAEWIAAHYASKKEMKP